MLTKRKMMVLGPTEIEQDILNMGAEPMFYSRTEEYSLFLKDLFSDLQRLFKTASPVFVLPCSGTGVMEFAMSNMAPCSKQYAWSDVNAAITVNGGSFGKRWTDIASNLNIPYYEIRLGETEQMTVDILEEVIADADDGDYATLFLTHNETSIGKLTDIKALAECAHKHNLLVVVDAVSSLGINDIRMDEWGIDVLITSSQKGLALPPGLGLISFNEKALQFSLAQKHSGRPTSFYFDVEQYYNNWRRNQTPFTPPIQLLTMLRGRLDKMLRVFDSTIWYYTDLTSYLRQSLNIAGYKLVESELMSNCVIAVHSPVDVRASQIVQRLALFHNIQVAPAAGDDKDKYFRVGCYGNINELDIDSFIHALNETVQFLRQHR